MWSLFQLKLYAAAAAKLLQLCLTLCDTTDCSPPGSSVYRIFQTRILEWVAMSFSRGSFWPRGQTYVSSISCIGRRVLYQWVTWKALLSTYGFSITSIGKTTIHLLIDFVSLSKINLVYLWGSISGFCSNDLCICLCTNTTGLITLVM